MIIYRVKLKNGMKLAGHKNPNSIETILYNRNITQRMKKRRKTYAHQTCLLGPSKLHLYIHF